MCRPRTFDTIAATGALIKQRRLICPFPFPGTARHGESEERLAHGSGRAANHTIVQIYYFENNQRKHTNEHMYLHV